MVKAILEGRKTQTRRVIKPQPEQDNFMGWIIDSTRRDVKQGDAMWGEIDSSYRRCPYGQVGDRLWVRETFISGLGVGGYVKGYNPDINSDAPTVDIIYRADDGPNERTAGPWKPSIFMPRWASRITLEITNVRVERVQGISGIDAIREGIPNGAYAVNPVKSFERLWDSINAKRGYGWDVNPWVFVVDFKVSND